MKKDKKHIDTRLGHLGLDPMSNYGIPNPPIYRTSTILSSSFAQHRGELPKPYTYGRNGTPTSAAFEGAVADIYGAETCISTPSGLAALTTALLAFTQTGGHMLFPDSLYGSTRRFVTNMLPMMGVETEFYPARINGDISGYIRPSTSLIFVESPGSLTFELQDLPAIVKAARSQTKTASAITIMVDNTWGTALHYPVLQLGADVVVEAATKYICGHSDISLGIAAASGIHGKALKQTAKNLGICAGPDDLYAGLRGLRTLRLRLEQSAANGLYLAERIEKHPLVEAVLHPALTSSMDNAIYKRDFSGSCGLFGIVLRKEMSQEKLDKALEDMEIFAIGDSWGGYESLVKQAHYEITGRSFAKNHPEGYLVRLYAGLEHSEDLWADIEGVLAAVSAS